MELLRIVFGIAAIRRWRRRRNERRFFRLDDWIDGCDCDLVHDATSNEAIESLLALHEREVRSALSN
jgi:hypothetical protein